MSGLTVDGGSTFTVSRTYESQRDVLTSIDSRWAGASRARYDYVVDVLGRRSSVTQSGSAFADYYTDLNSATPTPVPVSQQFGYNGRSELTQASAYLGTSAVDTAKIPNRQYGFSYDNIGNRLTANRTGTPETYNSNALNQYTARTNLTIPFSGTTAATAVVLSKAGEPTVASRQGSLWSAEVTVSNETSPWLGPIGIYFGKNGTEKDLVRTEARVGQIPAKTQNFIYDADGNLIDDGMWVYTWDAENRLIQMVTAYQAAAVGFPNRKLQFRYDYLGRRVQKLVFDQGSGQLVYGRRFLYEGWNLIAEFADTGAVAIGGIVRSYTWGLDIARSLTEAGGVGALLQIADHASGKTYYPGYDGNGNVTVLVNGSNGAVAASFEYSPFGELVRTDASDPTAGDQPFRFSTKYLDSETGLIYYGRRYYTPSQGRFLGRDPLEDQGGPHLYGFCRNNSVNRWDRLGMLTQYADGYSPDDDDKSSPKDGDIRIDRITSPGGKVSEDILMIYRSSGPEGPGYYARDFDSTVEENFSSNISLGDIISPAQSPTTSEIRNAVFPFDHITVAAVSFVSGLVTPLTASQNTDAFINWVGLRNSNDLQAAKITGQMLSVVGAAFGSASSLPPVAPAPANARILILDPQRYPIPLDTLTRAGALYEPLPVNRTAASYNRQLALSGITRVPGMDLDEAPPAMFRNPGDPVLVQPTPPSQNRGAGASLGGQARGVPNGGTVIIAPGETWPIPRP